MVPDNRAICPQSSPHIPPGSSYCFSLLEQVHSGNSVRREALGLNPPQPFPAYHHQQVPQPHPHPYAYPYPYPYPYHHPSPYAHDMHATIQREIEKEKIREEIIREEIMRRRELEAEVRRELMMENELILRRGSHGVSHAAPSVTEINSPKRPLEETIVPSLVDVERLPFQRGSTDVRNSKMIPVVEVPGEKEKIILVAKQNEDTCGTKREASKVDASESPSGTDAKKKAREELSCALCKVSSTSEHALNEHLQGKKHKTKEAALKGKKFSIGFLSKKPAMATTVGPATVYRAKVSLGKTENEIDKLNKKEAIMATAVDQAKVSLDTNDLDRSSRKRKLTFWCEMCQISASSEKVWKSHRKGKKHKRQLYLRNQNCGDERQNQAG